MPTAHSLVAPTQKMSDDTPYRQSGPQAAAPQTLPTHPSQPPLMPAPGGDIRSVTTRPGPGAAPRGQTNSAPPQNAYGHSVPPQNAGYGSVPPQNHSVPPQNAGYGSVPPQNHSVPPQNAGYGSVPPQNHSVPPQNQPRGSTPPAGVSSRPDANREPRAVSSRPSGRAATAPAGTSAPQSRRAETPAESVAAAPSGRRWGLIIFVLLIDIGLASSGAWMLSQGLAN